MFKFVVEKLEFDYAYISQVAVFFSKRNTTMEIPQYFDLRKIASWQLEPGNTSVELPALQRNFVWKVNQIESLWNSLLRGYPVRFFFVIEDR